MEKFREPMASITFSARKGFALKKIFRMVRFTLFCFFLSLLQVMAVDSYSQQTRLTLNEQNQKLEDVLRTIENKSEFFFLYNRDLINVDQTVNINKKGQTITVILDDLLRGTDIKYSVVNRQIILSNLEGISGLNAQQQKKVSGKVTDNSGSGLPGVSVVVKGTTTGVITDMDGKYTIAKVPENATLQFSFVGMKTQEISVGNRTTINVTLEDETVGIEEVVAVGYGTQKKSNVSGAITSVNSKELHSTASNDIGQALQGKAPVFISKNSGAPGAETSIFLRGVGTLTNSSPLWIIDGVKGAPLDNFNDVESVQILKDAASSAIYGVEAANGVILVTTKKAKEGKISINYDGYFKSSQALGLPHMLGTQSYIDTYIARWKSNNPTLDPNSYLKSIYSQSSTEVAKLPNTNWADAMFRTGLEQVHSLSLSGRGDKSAYLISLMNEHDKGTLVNTGYSKSSIKLSFDQQVTSWLAFKESVNYSQSKERPFANTANSGKEIWDGIFRGNPAMKVYDSTNPMGTGYGYFTDTFASTIDWQGTNPLESAMNTDFWTKHDVAWGNFQVKVTPLKDLVWTTNVSGSFQNDNMSQFRYNSYGGISINSKNFFTSSYSSINQFEYQENNMKKYLVNSFVEYSKSVNKNQFGIMLGTEFFESLDHGAYGYATNGIPSEDLRTVELTSNRNGYNYFNEDSGYSFFGRLNYSYNDKYLLTATLRNDASSIFAPGKRQAFFPALSVGWNIAKEAFFTGDIINDLKLRYGIGVSGNDNVPSNLWRQEYAQNSSGTWQATKVVNTDITWEKTTTNNIGVDLGLWQNAFTATLDFYTKKTKDALLQIALPSTTGFGSFYANRGEIENKGLELTLGYKSSLGSLNYSINGNVAYNENKVLNIGNATYLSGGDYNRTYQNGPVSSFYGYLADGLYRSQSEIDNLNANAIAKGSSSYDGTIAPGDIKFKDINGDGTITGDDQQIIGNPWPKYVFGFNISMEYRGVDFSMSWQGLAGIDVYNRTLRYTQNMFGDDNTTSAVFDAWSTSNPNSSIPRLGNSAHNYERTNSYLVEDGSYLRLKNLQFGYNVSKELLSKIKLQKLRIFLGMENALTFTKFKGFDPEFMSGDSNYERGVYNLSQYPQSRSIILGVQVGF